MHYIQAVFASLSESWLTDRFAVDVRPHTASFNGPAPQSRERARGINKLPARVLDILLTISLDKQIASSGTLAVPTLSVLLLEVGKNCGLAKRWAEAGGPVVTVFAASYLTGHSTEPTRLRAHALRSLSIHFIQRGCLLRQPRRPWAETWKHPGTVIPTMQPLVRKWILYISIIPSCPALALASGTSSLFYVRCSRKDCS